MSTPVERPPPQPPEQPVARRYRALRALGQGGQGSVWLAEDELTGAQVAVKLSPDSPTRNASKREVAVLRALRLPGVVRLLDEGVWEGQHFIVTELVEGRPFPGVSTPAPWEAIAEATRGLLEAVGQVHRAGVVHGDLKPANALVTADGRVRLLDFGMAQTRAGLLDPSQEQPLGGTLHYLSPEVIDGGRPEARSDLFAAGVMILRALTGQLPWPAGNLAELVQRRRDGGPTLPSHLGLSVPEPVEAALLAMLSLGRTGRPRSAAEALRALGLAESEHALSLPWAAVGPPLAQAELAAVFAGPERILHLPSDAAALLHHATGGHRARVAEELRAWVAAGVAREEGSHLRVDAATLASLRSEGVLPLGLPTAAPPPSAPELRRVLAVVCLAAEHARAPLLAEVLGERRPDVDARLARLSTAGAAELDAAGRWWDLTAGACLADLDETERAALHTEIARALPMDAPGRLHHLLAARAAVPTLVEAALVTSRHWLRAGRLADAMAAAEVGLQVLRSEVYAPASAQALVDTYVLAALTTEMPPVLARAAWELRRLPRLPERDARAALLDASLHALSGRGEQALELVTALRPPASAELALWIPAIEVQAATALPVEGEAFVLDQVEAWVQAHPSNEAETRLATWKGHLRSRQGRSVEAAELHGRAARGRLGLHERVAAVIHEAEAWADAGQDRRARLQAGQARALAAEARDALLEARATVLERRLVAKAREPVPPDEALVETVSSLGAPTLAARAALTEAVIARNHGYTEAAARLAMRAKAGFDATARPAQALLSAALAAESGSPAGLWWAREHFGGVDPRAETARLLQVCALLHASTGVTEWAEAGRLLAAQLGPLDPDRTLEILTIGEALAMLGS